MEKTTSEQLYDLYSSPNSGDKIKNMGGICGTYGRGEWCIQACGGKI